MNSLAMGSAWWEDLQRQDDDTGVRASPGSLRVLLICPAERTHPVWTCVERCCSGCQLTHATDLDRAHELVRESTFEAIVAHIDAPGFAGEPGVRALARQQAAPLVVLAERMDEAEANTLLRLGAQDCVESGTLDAATLQRTLRQAIQRERHVEQLARMACHDWLTDFLNARAFEAALSRGVTRARQSGRRLALLFVDLDGFKDVNDELGHGVGDQLLRIVSRRLLAAVRRDDAAGRLGGDEFGVLIHDLEDARSAQEAARRLLGAIHACIDLQGRRISVSASVGVALYPDAGPSPRALLTAADAAMYAAKNAGGNRIVTWCANPGLRPLIDSPPPAD